MTLEFYGTEAVIVEIREKMVGSSVFPKRKAQWEEPERSSGIWYRKMGINDCWEARGPARQVYVELSKEIKKVLEERVEYLNEGEPILQTVTFSLYMVGRKTTRARPTVLFCCERPNPRKKARDIIKESGVLDRYPGFVLGDCSHPPEFDRSPIRLALDDDTEPEVPNALCTEQIVLYRPSKIVCGVQIFVAGSENTLLQKATLGGIMCAQGRYFGLTVAHAFEKSVAVATTSQANNFEFNLEENYDDLEEDDSSLDATSRGSATPKSPHAAKSSDSILSSPASSFSGTLASLSISGNDTPTDGPSSSGVLIPVSLIQRNDEVQAELCIGNTVTSAEDEQLLVVGDLILTSTHGQNPGLDYALIELVTPQLQTWNHIANPNKYARNIDPEKVIATGPADTDILAATGSGRVLRGKLFGTPTFMIIAGSKKFQEIWTVRLNGKLAKGDCGSWIVGPITGDVYGHVISGDPDSGIAYIVPALQIHEDIKEVFSPDIELSTRRNQVRITQVPETPTAPKQPLNLLMEAIPISQRHPRNEISLGGDQGGTVEQLAVDGQSNVEIGALNVDEDPIPVSEIQQLDGIPLEGDHTAEQIDVDSQSKLQIEVADVDEGHSPNSRTLWPKIAITGIFHRMYDWLLKLFWGTEMDITMIGLQNAGKTSLLRVLAGGEFTLDSIPTVGFSMKRVHKELVTIKIWDLGGQPRFRSMWERYCRGTNAIIWVVDSADTQELPLAKEELQLLLDKPALRGIPLLVLVNKTDLEKSMSVDEAIEALDLKSFSAREISCYGVSAKEETNLDAVLQWLVSKAGKKVDSGIAGQRKALIGHE